MVVHVSLLPHILFTKVLGNGFTILRVLKVSMLQVWKASMFSHWELEKGLLHPYLLFRRCHCCNACTNLGGWDGVDVFTLGDGQGFTVSILKVEEKSLYKP